MPERDLRFDPTNISQFYADVSRETGTAHRLNLQTVISGSDAILQVGDLLGMTNAHSILIVQDATPILRAGIPVKELVADRLGASGVSVQSVTLSDPAGVKTTRRNIAVVRERLEANTVVLALGSGTVADIAKHAVYEFEQGHPGEPLRLVSLPTANSVCAYTSGMAVLSLDGVKRTVPSRLPDALILDSKLLSDAPREFTNGGIGDSAVAASTLAEYRLANLFGFGRWEPAAWLVLEEVRDTIVAGDSALTASDANRDADAAELLAKILSVCGLAMTFAEESAPLSGLEHVTSHMLDMSADHVGRPIGNHGSQCGLATALVLIAFQHLLDEVDISHVDIANVLPDEDREREVVERVFAEIDPSGNTAATCWEDYSSKLASWASNREHVEHVQRNWSAIRSELRQYLVDPRDFLAALAACGHPLRFEDVPPGITGEEAHWAFGNARLMRKRLTVADLLYFAGAWNDAFVDDVFARFEELRSSVIAEFSSNGHRSSPRENCISGPDRSQHG